MDGKGSSGDPLSGLRRVADAQSLRALTHPVRIALIEALTVDGPLTATEAAEVVGESPTTCSFHLRQLARYGFVEEAERGPGRRPSWRMRSIGTVIASEGGDPEANVAAAAVSGPVRQRLLEHLDRREMSRASYPKRWRDLAQINQHLLFVTAEELAELERRLHQMLMELYPRIADEGARPKGALPVEMVSFIFPLRLPDPAEAPSD